MRTVLRLCIGRLDVSRMLDDGGRMSREAYVRFCEGLGVQLPRPTHPYALDEFCAYCIKLALFCQAR